MNGKETSQGSFLKYTAHEFKKMLKTDKDNSLASYAVDAHNKSYEFWQGIHQQFICLAKKLLIKNQITHIIILVWNIGSWLKNLVIICFRPPGIMKPE